MDINILIITLEGHKLKSRDIPKVRGYIAGKFPEYLELHNHIGENSFKYGYPMVQYKTFNGVPGVMALNEASKILIQAFYDIDHIDLKEAIIEIMERGYSVKKQAFGTSEHLISYRFLSPWMALNQKNYSDYQKADEQGKIEILKKILIGNIISMSKYLGYTVDRQIQVLIKLKPMMVNYKNQKMTGFMGDFLANFQIPDYLGLGKSVSRGFGTVMKMTEGTFQ